MVRRRGLAALLLALGTALAGWPLAAACQETAQEQAADEVLTLEEAAALLEIEPGTLERLAVAGVVPGRRLGEHWRFHRQRLLAWLADADSIGGTVAPSPPAVDGLEAARGRGPGGEPVAEESVGEPPPADSASDISLRNRRILLAPGQLVLEPQISYTRADTPDILFFDLASEDPPITATVGDSASIEQNITTASVTGRYGLYPGIEGFGGLIFQDRRIKSDTEPQEVDTELRSVFLGMRGTAVRESLHLPNVVIGVQGVAPTGDSSWAVNGNIFAVKSADPLALFAGLEYQHTFSRDFDKLRKLEPEDTFRAQAGFVFAVTQQTSLNASVQGLFVLDSNFDLGGRMQVDQPEVEQPRSGSIDSNEEFSLRLGLTQRLGADLFVEPSVAFSLNGPGDFVTFGLRLPWIAYP